MGIGDLFSGTFKVPNPFYRKSVSSSQVNTLPTGSSFITTGKPSWRNLSELFYLLNCFKQNPVIQTVILTKAKAWGNMRFSVEDLKSGDIIPIEKYDKDKGKLRDLVDQPNPMQSTSEWLMQSKVYQEVFGNSYGYASVPNSFDNIFTYQDINAINNLPAYRVAPVLTGMWLEATRKDEIIKKYEFYNLNNKTEFFNTNRILHTNDVNITFDKNFTKGESRLNSLQKPISNIDAALESLNVLLVKRGALGILTSDKKDEAVGNIPLSNTELEGIQNEFKKYGLMDDQWTQLISPMPLKYQRMAMNSKELGILDGMANDARFVCNAFGVPEGLIPYYTKKGGLATENDALEKRLYNSTIIPESTHWMKNLNNFLKTRNHGIQLLGTFDHLKVLQTNQKEEAETNKINSETAESQFMSGLITMGERATACGTVLSDKKYEELRIWDLQPEELSAIGINQNTQGNGEE